MSYKIFTKRGIAYGVDDEGNTFHIPVQYLNEALSDGGQLLADNTVKQWTLNKRDRANLPAKNNLWKKEAVEDSGYSIQTYKNAMCREGLTGAVKPEEKTVVAPKRASDCTMTSEQWKEYQDYLKWADEVTALNKETPFGYTGTPTAHNARNGDTWYTDTEQDWWMQFYTLTVTPAATEHDGPQYNYEFNQAKWDEYTKGWTALEQERYKKLVDCRMASERIRAEGRHLWCNEGDPDHLKYYPNDCVMLTPRKRKEVAYSPPINNQAWDCTQDGGSGRTCPEQAGGYSNRSADNVQACGSNDT